MTSLNIYLAGLILYAVCQFINRTIIGEKMLALLTDENKLAVTKDTKQFRKTQSVVVFGLTIIFIASLMINVKYVFSSALIFFMLFLVISIVSSFMLFKIYHRHKFPKEFYRLFLISRAINFLTILIILICLGYVTNWFHALS